MKKLKLNDRSSFKETEDFWQALHLTQLRFPEYSFEIWDQYYAICETYSLDEDPRAHSSGDTAKLIETMKIEEQLDFIDANQSQRQDYELLHPCTEYEKRLINWLYSAILHHRELQELSVEQLNTKFRERILSSKQQPISSDELDNLLQSNRQLRRDSETIDTQSARRISNLYRVIIGMAVGEYGYLGNPSTTGLDQKTSASTKISGSIAQTGQSLSSETVREILNTAWDKLDLKEVALHKHLD